LLILSNEEIEQLITMPECIAVLEEMYRDSANDATLSMPRTDHLAPTQLDNAYYAFKHMGGIWPRRKIAALRLNSDIITHPVVHGDARRVKSPQANGRWVGLVELFNTETGELEAIFPDGVAQRMRVGAANGIAAKWLARADARTAGMIGSGWQAGAQLLALVSVRKIHEVKVYSTTRAHREEFAEWARRQTGINVRAVDTPEACARDVDILLAATSSLAPVLRPEWVHPGMHLSCIKLPEVDANVLDCCQRVVVHSSTQTEQIDNILPGTKNIPRQTGKGWWKNPGSRWEKFPDLPSLVAQHNPGRATDQEVTCFINNVGLGLQFAALGALILDKARKLGVGRELPREWFSETVHP